MPFFLPLLNSSQSCSRFPDCLVMMPWFLSFLVRSATYSKRKKEKLMNILTKIYLPQMIESKHLMDRILYQIQNVQYMSLIKRSIRCLKLNWFTIYVCLFSIFTVVTSLLVYSADHIPKCLEVVQQATKPRTSSECITCQVWENQKWHHCFESKLINSYWNHVCMWNV